MRKILIILLIVIIAAVVTFYLGKQLFLNRFKDFLIRKIEISTERGIAIEAVGFVPLKGISLTGVTLYKDRLYKEKELYIPSLYVKFPVIKLLIHKTFFPTITVRNLRLRNASLDGSFGFSVKRVKKIETAEGVLRAIQSIWFRNLSIKNAFLNIRNIKGSVDVSPESIKTTNIRFLLNNEPCALTLEIINPAEELTAKLEVSSSKFNLTSHMKKEDEIYKITEIKGGFLNSAFELMGEISAEGEENIKAPILSLYGKADIDIKDAIYFASDEFKKSVRILDPEGRTSNSIYFKGNLKDISSSELGIKSSAPYLKIWDFKLDKFYMDARIKDGLVHVPLLSAYPYNGMLIASAELDLTDEAMPYQASCRLSKIDIAALFRNTELGKRNIRGLLFSEFAVKGDAKSIDSMEGTGNIFITDANLGPMPLLTPLVGNLYGYFQNVFAGLKRIDITKGSCNFRIANRRISTNNLVLWGDIVSVHARGYIDFDKNLNFEVENKFLEPEEAGLSDWEKTLQEMITRFGKLMSKARLTGTIEKPKWKFEYLGGIQNILKGGLDKILKDIFE